MRAAEEEEAAGVEVDEEMEAMIGKEPEVQATSPEQDSEVEAEA